MEKLVYKCSHCGWERTIPAQWADVSPRYCENKKCRYSGRIKNDRTSFLKEPKALLILKAKKEEPKEHVPTSKKVELPESQANKRMESKRERRKNRRG